MLTAARISSGRRRISFGSVRSSVAAVRRWCSHQLPISNASTTDTKAYRRRRERLAAAGRCAGRADSFMRELNPCVFAFQHWSALPGFAWGGLEAVARLSGTASRRLGPPRGKALFYTGTTCPSLERRCQLRCFEGVEREQWPQPASLLESSAPEVGPAPHAGPQYGYRKVPQSAAGTRPISCRRIRLGKDCPAGPKLGAHTSCDG